MGNPAQGMVTRSNCPVSYLKGSKMLILQGLWEGVGNESQECGKTRQLTDPLRKGLMCPWPAQFS